MNLVVDTTGAPPAMEDLLLKLQKQWDANLYGVGFPSASFYGRNGAATCTHVNAVNAAVVALWGFGIPRKNIVFTFTAGEMNEQFQYTDCTLKLEWIPRPDLETP
jgi:hypothetical protein